MHLPRWRREQRAKKFNKFALLLRLVLVGFFLLILVLVGLFINREIRLSKLSRDSRVTIVLATKPIFLLSLEPQGNLTFLSIPENTYIEVLHGFGSYRIGAVWKLGEQEKIAGELLQQTTQEFLGVPVDGWIGTNMEHGTWNMEHGKEAIINWKNNLTSWKIFLKPKNMLNTLRSLRTNLTIFDLARVWWQVKFTRFDKIQFLDLGKSSALTTLVLADGSQALTADQALLDSGFMGLFKDSKFAADRVLIEVLNGTDKPGLANRVSRLITNLGGSLISVSNSMQKVNSCQLRGENQFLQTFTARKLAQIYHCQIKSGKQDSRADLQIIIGEDYWRKLFQR